MQCTVGNVALRGVYQVQGLSFFTPATLFNKQTSVHHHNERSLLKGKHELSCSCHVYRNFSVGCAEGLVFTELAQRHQNSFFSLYRKTPSRKDSYYNKLDNKRATTSRHGSGFALEFGRGPRTFMSLFSGAKTRATSR
jgi:hypothetical protein